MIDCEAVTNCRLSLTQGTVFDVTGNKSYTPGASYNGTSQIYCPPSLHCSSRTLSLSSKYPAPKLQD